MKQTRSQVDLKGKIGGGKVINLLHVRASNFYGGPEKQIVEHLALLRKDEYRVAVASFDELCENLLLSQAASRGIRNHTLCRNARIALRQLRNLIVEDSIDVVCTHGYKAAILVMVLKPLLKCKTVIFIRGRTRENRKVRMLQSIEDRLSWFFDAVIAVSESEARRLPDRPRWMKPKTVFCVRNAVECADVSESEKSSCRSELITEFALDESATLFVSAGRLSPEKGYMDLVHAVAIAGKRREQKSFAVLVCGEGQERSVLERKVRDKHVDNLIKFVGFRTDVEKFLLGMDCLLLPSKSEGIPNVLLEAMALGKPSISTNVGGVTEVINNGRQGVVVESNAAAMASAISDVLAGRYDLDGMGREALDRVKTSFSFENQAELLRKIYRSIL